MTTEFEAGRLSSRWIVEFEKQVMRGKHGLVYGNIQDQSLWRGEYLTATDFLTAYFREKGFDLIVRYDIIDGFRFAEPSMRAAFDSLVKRRLADSHLELGAGADLIEPASAPGSGVADAPPARALATPASAEAPAPRGRPLFSRGLRRVPPEEAFGQLRLALSQPATAVAAIVDMGDLLTTDAARYSPDERFTLGLLKKCTLEGAVVREGPRAGYRNTIVLLASELKRVPEWLYRDNPFVSLVQASCPAIDERRQFALQFLRPTAGSRGFFGGDRIPDPCPGSTPLLDRLAEEIAERTEGFQAWDLEALRRTSWVEKIPATEPKKLVDFFKFGARHDPWEEMGRDKVSTAAETLSARVIGQPNAIQAVTAMLTSARVGLSLSGSGSRTGKPKGVFFFVGPTGVGKTELAKAVTELVFGDEQAFARFDMSEYKEEHAAEKLAGSPPGFVGYEEGGQLTERVLERPHSILLFDEIEKAHPRVLDKFLQILEDGRLTDGKGQTAYFNQTAIIFTSNLGASELVDATKGDVAAFTYEQVAAYFQDRVRDYFTRVIGRAELLNRLGDGVVAFDLLRPEFVAPIGEKFLRMLAAGALEKYGLEIRYDPSILETVRTRMTQENNLIFGGRRVKTLLEGLVERPLNRWLFESVPALDVLAGTSIDLALDAGGALRVTSCGGSCV